MNQNYVTIVTDHFYDQITNIFIPRGSCNLLLDICKYLKKKYRLKFYLIQMAKCDFRKYKYPFHIRGIEADSIQSFRQKIKSMNLMNVHYNNIDLLIDSNNQSFCTATIHTNYYLDKKFDIPDNILLKKIFVVNEKYLSLSNSKLCLIKNGIDSDFFTFKKNKALKNPITLFFPNVPNKNKNLKFALNLVNDLNSIGFKYSFKLLIAGMVGNINDYIKGVGILSKKQMKRIYNQSHFSIIPSFSESCSLCMLESMSCGTIPLVNDIYGMKEYIQDGLTGFVTSIYNKAEWIDKIFSVLNDKKKYDKIRQFGTNEVKNIYNIKTTAEAYYYEWCKIFKFNTQK